MNITPEIMIGVVVAAVALPVMLIMLIPRNAPKEKTFKCARCKTVTQHTKRTIEAWRNDKRKFFCQTCHVKWLESQPPRYRESNIHRGGSASSSGCLGVIVLFAVVPLVGYVLVRAYA